MTTPFASLLAEDLNEFLVFKRSMGHRYLRSEHTLRDFDRFIERHARDHRPFRLQEAVLAWLASKSSGRKRKTVEQDLGVIRQFCRYLQRRDPGVFVPDRNWVVTGPVERFVPRILEEADIRLLLRLAAKLERPRYRRSLYRTLILVLYGTGIRLGEAVRLKSREVDLDNEVLFVADSKGRSRWVPFHRSLTKELADYMEARRVVVSDDDPKATFFVGRNGRALSVTTASITLRKLLRDAGLKPPMGREGPRPYDLRHAYAVARLTRWYRAGVDLHNRLPWLSAYMGHKNILGTELYLKATPELLSRASRRFQRRFHDTQRRS
jgi:integrase